MSVHYIVCLLILTISPLSKCVIVLCLFIWPWKIDNSKNNLKTILSLIIWQNFLCFSPNNNLLTNASSIAYQFKYCSVYWRQFQIKMVVYDSNNIFFERYLLSTWIVIFRVGKSPIAWANSWKKMHKKVAGRWQTQEAFWFENIMKY